MNLARFLLSFAREPDFRNGVTITEEIIEAIRTLGDNLSFGVDTTSFEKTISASGIFPKLKLRFRSIPEVHNHLQRSSKGIKPLRDVRIPTRDGSWLGADVFLPLKSTPSPVLMNMSVYGYAFRIGVIRNETDLLASEDREDAWHETDRSDVSLYFK